MDEDSAGKGERGNRRASMRRRIEERGIDALIVSVPKLAKLLGYAPSTLYAYIKGGAFFLPYRLVNGAPAVLVEDVVDWLSDNSFEIAAAPGSAVRAKSDPDGMAEGLAASRSEILDRAAIERIAMRRASGR